MLSDVVVEEVDGIKNELKSQRLQIRALRSDVGQVKAQHVQTVAWSTNVQREISDLRWDGSESRGNNREELYTFFGVWEASTGASEMFWGARLRAFF